LLSSHEPKTIGKKGGEVNKFEEILLAKRVVPLSKSIDSREADRVTHSVQYLHYAGNEPIRLLVESNGGDMKSALDIYSAVKLCPVPVIGIVPRYAASFAVLVLQACSVRQAYPYAHLGLHHITYDATTAMSEEETLVERRRALQDFELMLGLYAERMKRSVEEIRPLFGSGRTLRYSAEAALREKLIDGIGEPSK
jgi:ATP-dependent protease ClpP protease subunit